jgi:hypothetical protein
MLLVTLVITGTYDSTAKAEAKSSLRARKLLNRRCRACLRAGFKINEVRRTVLKFFSSKKQRNWPALAGGFCCLSLEWFPLSMIFFHSRFSSVLAFPASSCFVTKFWNQGFRQSSAGIDRLDH